MQMSFDPSLFSELPPSHYEKKLKAWGYSRIAGTDEAGRGALAGPVVAAAVILPHPFRVKGVRDSKLIPEAERETLYEQIVEHAVCWSVGMVDNFEIDRINIFQASLRAMREAVSSLSLKPDFLLIDGQHTLSLDLPQRAVVKGDRHCQSVAAASILAKVTRDRLMRALETSYPHFTFSTHKGYPTSTHRREIMQSGVLPIHRKSFTLLPVKAVGSES